MDVEFHRDASLRRPVFVGAFRGWNDAADAASTAVEFLQDSWGAEPLATIQPDEFFDFQSTRPAVRRDEGRPRIEWPETVFTWCSIPGADRDAVLLCGTEPSLRWKRFTAAVHQVLERSGVQLAVMLGALLADVPHSRPVSVSGSASDPRLAKRLGLATSRYEGPTGIVGVLHDRLRHVSLDSLSLWAATPHYIRDAPSPKAALALVERLGSLLSVGVDTSGLAEKSGRYERAVERAVAGDADIESYVRRLEEQWDDRARAESATGDEIAERFQQYLREVADGD